MENKFEKVLWSVRYVVILAVILSIVASISLTKSSYIPKPKINKTIPIKNKSIDDIILNKS